MGRVGAAGWACRGCAAAVSGVDRASSRDRSVTVAPQSVIARTTKLTTQSTRIGPFCHIVTYLTRGGGGPLRAANTQAAAESGQAAGISTIYVTAPDAAFPVCSGPNLGMVAVSSTQRARGCPLRPAALTRGTRARRCPGRRSRRRAPAHGWKPSTPRARPKGHVVPQPDTQPQVPRPRRRHRRRRRRRRRHRRGRRDHAAGGTGHATTTTSATTSAPPPAAAPPRCPPPRPPPPSRPATRARRPPAARPARRLHRQAGRHPDRHHRPLFGHPGLWTRLYAANATIIGADPGQIAPGERLTVKLARHGKTGKVTTARAGAPASRTAGPAAAGGHPARRRPPAAAQAPTASTGAAPGGSFGACVRSRESGGNYQATNGGGYYGAYQFSASTWAASAATPPTSATPARPSKTRCSPTRSPEAASPTGQPTTAANPPAHRWADRR